jgi:hypothetical protein
VAARAEETLPATTARQAGPAEGGLGAAWPGQAPGLRGSLPPQQQQQRRLSSLWLFSSAAAAAAACGSAAAAGAVPQVAARRLGLQA